MSGSSPSPRTYQARIRFANATSQSDTERDVRGMSIKVSGVGGDNLTPGESNQDFILNSHPVMMVGDTKEFLDLLQAVEAGGATDGALFRHASARRRRGAGVAPARDEPPRDSLLEHDALPVRRRPGRQVHRAPRVAADDPAARLR